MSSAQYSANIWTGEEEENGSAVARIDDLDRILTKLDSDLTEMEHATPWDLDHQEEQTEQAPEAEPDTPDVVLNLEPDADPSIDSMRLYLREMSVVPLLKREDEIRIANRLKAASDRSTRSFRAP